MGNGLHYVYTGNVHDKAGGSTWCPDCGELLIERDWYQLGRWGLTQDGCCAAWLEDPWCLHGPARDLGRPAPAGATASQIGDILLFQKIGDILFLPRPYSARGK